MQALYDKQLLFKNIDLLQIKLTKGLQGNFTIFKSHFFYFVINYNYQLRLLHSNIIKFKLFF